MDSAPACWLFLTNRGQEEIYVLNENGSFSETCNSVCRIQASKFYSREHCVANNETLRDHQCPVPEPWVV